MLSLLYSCYYNAPALTNLSSVAHKLCDLEDLMHSLWLPSGSAVHVLQSWIHCPRSAWFGGSEHHLGLSLYPFCFIWGLSLDWFSGQQSWGRRLPADSSEQGSFSLGMFCPGALVPRAFADGAQRGLFWQVLSLHPRTCGHSLWWDRPGNSVWMLQTNFNGVTSSCNKWKLVALSYMV